jgi:hypothetical protein
MTPSSIPLMISYSASKFYKVHYTHRKSNVKLEQFLNLLKHFIDHQKTLIVQNRQL